LDIEPATPSFLDVRGNVYLTCLDDFLISYKVPCQFESHSLRQPVGHFSAPTSRAFSALLRRDAREKSCCERATVLVKVIAATIKSERHAVEWIFSEKRPD
jgi:hypothetical protein